MQYSLADYILSIKPNDATLAQIFQKVDIGGEGSPVGSINVSLNSNLWSTTGFATGAWIHSKNLDRTGTIAINISQLSDNVAKFKQLVNVYYTGNYGGLTMSLIDSDGNEVCSAVDCRPVQIPAQDFSTTAQMQSWSFTCGKITIN